MALFGNADVSMLQKRVSDLEVELDTSNARVAELEALNSDYKKTIENFHLSTSTYDQKIEELNRQHESEVKALNNKLIETENSVNKRLNQTLQSIGVSNFLMEIPLTVKSNKEVYEKYLSMPPGSDKTKFFQENELQIRKGMGLE